MKRQSSLSSWISKAKNPASLDGNDECNDEIDSLGYLAESIGLLIVIAAVQ